MCGIAGFAGIEDPLARERLITCLGEEIDYRGGDAIGYISLNGKVRTDRRLGKWTKAPRSFVERAATGAHVILHSRYATCGKKNSVKHAHPFSIQRNMRPVLHGVHNGMVPDAWDSAKKHGRKCKVDSRELFELIADESWAKIRKLEGYGTVAYAHHNDPSKLLLCKMSDGGDLVVYKTKSGGAVFGSTDWIVEDACKRAKVKLDFDWEVKTGVVYQLNETGLRFTKLDNVKLKDYVRPVAYVAPVGSASLTDQSEVNSDLGFMVREYLFEEEDAVEEDGENIVINKVEFQRWLAKQASQ